MPDTLGKRVAWQVPETAPSRVSFRPWRKPPIFAAAASFFLTQLVEITRASKACMLRLDAGHEHIELVASHRVRDRRRRESRFRSATCRALSSSAR